MTSEAGEPRGYRVELVGGSRVNLRCAHCKLSARTINGVLTNHAPTCEYRISVENEEAPPFNYDPGCGKIPPSFPNRREWNKVNFGWAWLFDPWTGDVRSPKAVGLDPYGERLEAATKMISDA